MEVTIKTGPYDGQAGLVKVAILSSPILEAVEQLVGRLLAAVLLHLTLAPTKKGKVNLKRHINL